MRCSEFNLGEAGLGRMLDASVFSPMVPQPGSSQNPLHNGSETQLKTEYLWHAHTLPFENLFK